VGEIRVHRRRAPAHGGCGGRESRLGDGRKGVSV